MLSRNPLEPVRELPSKDDAAQALRLAIIAELDAINLYLQLSSAVKDERVRRVLEDVANEERTHFGEFLSLLKDLDPRQAAELEAGAREVKELTGPSTASDPQEAQSPAPDLADAVRSAAERARRLRGVLTYVRAGRGAVAVPRASVTEDDVIRASPEALPLSRLGVEFAVAREELDASARLGLGAPAAALRAAERLAVAEDSLVASALSSSAGVRVSGSWSQPGSFARLLSEALSRMTVSYPVALLLNPSDRAYLASVIDQAGLDELSRASRLVDTIVASPGVPQGAAILTSQSPSCVDVVVGADGELEQEAPQAGELRYYLWETLAVRVKVPSCVAVISRSEGHA